MDSKGSSRRWIAVGISGVLTLGIFVGVAAGISPPGLRTTQAKAPWPRP